MPTTGRTDKGEELIKETTVPEETRLHEGRGLEHTAIDANGETLTPDIADSGRRLRILKTR